MTPFQVAGKATAESLGYLRESGEGPRVHKKDILEAVDKSLLRLGTDYIDLLQVEAERPGCRRVDRVDCASSREKMFFF